MLMILVGVPLIPCERTFDTSSENGSRPLVSTVRRAHFVQESCLDISTLVFNRIINLSPYRVSTKDDAHSEVVAVVPVKYGSTLVSSREEVRGCS